MNTKFTRIKPRTYLYLLVMIASTLLLPIHSINSISIILLLTFWGVALDFKSLKKSFKKIIVFIVLYGTFVLGATYSPDLKEALTILRIRLPFLLLPVIVLTIRESEVFSFKNQEKFKKIFIYVVLLACFYCHLNLIIDYLNNTIVPIEKIVSEYNFGYSKLTSYLKFHPTYFSYLLLVAIIFNFNVIKFSTLRNKIFFNISFVYLTLFLFQIGSRSSMLIIVFLVVIYSFHLLKNKSYKSLWKGILTLSLITIISFQFTFTIKRVKQALNVFIPQKGMVHSSGGYRLYSYNAFKTEYPKNPILGTGLGGAQKGLNNYFDQIGFLHMKGLDYHNQYFQTLIELGLLGFIFLIIFFVYLIRIGFQYQNKEYLCFLLITLVLLMFENLFIRHKGIVIFALFNSYYLACFYNKGNECS